MPKKLRKDHAGAEPLSHVVYFVVTPGLVQFRNLLGKANFDFNTIRASLVELGKMVTPPKVNFAVVWEPHDIKGAVLEAQTYATNSLFVYAVDSLDGYMRNQSTTPSVLTNDELRSFVRGEFQSLAPKRKVSAGDIKELEKKLVGKRIEPDSLLKEFRDIFIGRSYRPGQRARFDKLVSICPNIPSHYRAAVHILISWRNRHVHGNADDHIDAVIENDWISGLAALAVTNPRSKGADLLARYKADQDPTPDDVTTLVALLHRTLTAVDRCLIQQANIDYYADEAIRRLLGSMPDVQSFDKHYWGREIGGKAYKLMGMTLDSGFTRSRRSNCPVTAKVVSDSVWLNLASLSRVELYKTVGLKA